VAATARSESAAEVLCAELSVDGLPMDRAVAESIVARFAGPRPRSEAEADELRRRRDAQVLRHAPDAGPVDLRSLNRPGFRDCSGYWVTASRAGAA
jgi:DNA polymerase-1